MFRLQQSILTTVALPAALALIMFGLGLSLDLAETSPSVARRPKAVVIALVAQVLILPAICFGLVVLFGLEPLLAVGMMLLAASPGGTTANLYSHLFGGDVALNVTLTAVNSVLAAFTLPLVVNLSIAHFVDGGEALGPAGRQGRSRSSRWSSSRSCSACWSAAGRRPSPTAPTSRSGSRRPWSWPP